ncbi:MAG: MFS transporter [Gammaproteobacteria bacterium]|nr:MFS transporter [Gammaproteobacteria bacterium]MDP2140461.1 MFS transporter [Gammaproteobacteria bacterium]MDP2349500.1 MFS transporter [Gammaproteobacteria bacterium]
MNGTVARLVNRAVDLREGEGAALGWSFAYYFCLLCAYYILRPIRDEMGVAGGVNNLAWLFTGTLVGMMLIHPVFTSLVKTLPRNRFVPLTYRFFIANLVIFFAVFQMIPEENSVWIGRIFFIWVSVFNLFVISVFWSFMTDIYRSAQSKRLFGILAVGGTAGAIMGSSITSALVSVLGPVNLLLVSALLLEAAARVSNALEKSEEKLAVAALRDEIKDAAKLASAPSAGEEISHMNAAPTQSPEPTDVQKASAIKAVADKQSEIIGGGVFEGITDVLKSPYLIGIAVLMLLFTITSTYLYFMQAEIVEGASQDSRVRTQLFANIDLIVNIITLITQLFLTGRILKWFGIGLSLAFLPLVSLVGFGILGAAPALAVLVIFQILRRAGNFAIQRPAREVLYTVLPRTEKYKAKNFNDTFVYRVGDQVGAWSYTAMGWLGLGVSSLAISMVPVSVVWLVLALWLGRRYRDYNTIQNATALQEPAADSVNVATSPAAPG